jgi:tetratricopeptide (TPR) repeat protein
MSTADDHFNLGNSLLREGKWQDAIVEYDSALRLQPNDVEVHCNLGMALMSLSRLDKAVAHFRTALRLRPSLAHAHNNLGIALRRQGNWEEAIHCFKRAIQFNPLLAEAYYNLGNACKDQSRWDDAVAHYLQALRLNPGIANAHNNLGSVLQSQNKHGEAKVHYRQAIHLDPNHAEAHRNLGTVLQGDGEFDDALEHYVQAVFIRPEFAEAHHDRALLWLLRGDFDRGWPEYEWRLKLPGADRRVFVEPLWDGSPLAGRTILLHAEQGLGDTIQFLRYIPLVKQCGCRVIFECQPPLLRLLNNNPDIECLCARGSPLPPFDVRMPLMSLPRIFHRLGHNAPSSNPYLHPFAALQAEWQSRFRTEFVDETSVTLTSHSALRTPHFLIGIAWKGNPAFRGDRQRSIPLEEFAPLKNVPGVVLVSLQKEFGTKQLHEKDRHSALRTPHFVRRVPQLDEASGSFMDTGAIMKSLDLVICSDSAVAHLAGSLGVPVWVALPLVPDWRWLLKREDSPWYPTMRLYRQTKRGQWGDVFDSMAEQLNRITSAT